MLSTISFGDSIDFLNHKQEEQPKDSVLPKPLFPMEITLTEVDCLSIYPPIPPCQCQGQFNERCWLLGLLVIRDHRKELGIPEREGCWECVMLEALQKAVRMKTYRMQICNELRFWSSAACGRTCSLLRGRVSHYAVTALPLEHHVWSVLQDVSIWEGKSQIGDFSIPKPTLTCSFANIMQKILFECHQYITYMFSWDQKVRVHSSVLSFCTEPVMWVVSAPPPPCFISYTSLFSSGLKNSTEPNLLAINKTGLLCHSGEYSSCSSLSPSSLPKASVWESLFYRLPCQADILIIWNASISAGSSFQFLWPSKRIWTLPC